MPEGPEIRRAADRIAGVLEGEILDDAAFALPAMQGRESEFIGARVVAIETRGKALLTHFEHGMTIYSHNQLYGRWYVMKRDAYPNTGRSLRMALHTEKHSALLYSASDISIWSQSDLAMHPFLAKLGPDILSESLTWRDIVSRLENPRFEKRQVASLYLDQGFLAGVGNYLRSEILFDAKIDPQARPSDLSRKQKNELARSTLKVSKRSYSSAGLTNPPRRVATLRRKGLKRSAYRHAVFARDNKPCYDCGEMVEKDLLGARRLYWCPNCQAP